MINRTALDQEIEKQHREEAQFQKQSQRTLQETAILYAAVNPGIVFQGASITAAYNPPENPDIRVVYLHERPPRSQGTNPTNEVITLTESDTGNNLERGINQFYTEIGDAREKFDSLAPEHSDAPTVTFCVGFADEETAQQQLQDHDHDLAVPEDY